MMVAIADKREEVTMVAGVLQDSQKRVKGERVKP